MSIELITIIILAVGLVGTLAYFLSRKAPVVTGNPEADSAIQVIVDAVGKIQGEQRASQEVQRSLKDELRATADHLKHLSISSMEREKRDQVYFQNIIDTSKSIEGVMRGSKTKGMAGENVVRELLMLFPQSMMVYDFKLGSKVVEFGIKLPDGRIYPIDSKVVALEELAQLQETVDEPTKQRLIAKIELAVLRKAREVSDYISPPITYERAMMAVPDAIHHLLRDSLLRSWRDYSVMILPYSLTIPYLLTFMDLQRKHATHLDEERVKAFLEDLAMSLSKIDDILDNKLAKGSVMIGNAYTESKQLVNKVKGEAVSLVTTKKAKSLVGANDTIDN